MSVWLTPRPWEARYQLYRRLGGPEGRCRLVRKISAPLGFDLRSGQPVASRYTDWAIAAHREQLGCWKTELKHIARCVAKMKFRVCVFACVRACRLSITVRRHGRSVHRRLCLSKPSVQRLPSLLCWPSYAFYKSLSLLITANSGRARSRWKKHEIKTSASVSQTLEHLSIFRGTHAYGGGIKIY